MLQAARRRSSRDAVLRIAPGATGRRGDAAAAARLLACAANCDAGPASTDAPPASSQTTSPTSPIGKRAWVISESDGTRRAGWCASNRRATSPRSRSRPFAPRRACCARATKARAPSHRARGPTRRRRSVARCLNGKPLKSSERNAQSARGRIAELRYDNKLGASSCSSPRQPRSRRAHARLAATSASRAARRHAPLQPRVRLLPRVRRRVAARRCRHCSSAASIMRRELGHARADADRRRAAAASRSSTSSSRGPSRAEWSARSSRTAMRSRTSGCGG